MCGRYASTKGRPELLEGFAAEDGTEAAPLEPDYNVAPTKPVPAIVTRPRDDGLHRQLRVLRWGLVPSWAKDISIGSRLINARVETLTAKPAFRKAATARRCLLPADGYYEWYGEEPPAGGRPRKQPYFLSRADGGLLAMAGIYEHWRDPEGAWLTTCAVVTGDAIDELGHLHDRSPVLVDPGDWASWLDPTLTDAGQAVSLLRAARPGELAPYPVSTEVNSVAHNGPQLLDPLPPADVLPSVVPLSYGN